VDKITLIDYKDVPRLKKYITERGKIRAPEDFRQLRLAPADADHGH
jgi:SSU ribosomal protein S18P